MVATPDPRRCSATPDLGTDLGTYFDDFLPGLMGRLLIEDLHDLTACFAISVTDESGPPWRIAIEAGRITHVGTDGPEPECCFVLNRETLREVIAARCAPAEAFFERRIEVEGDIERGLVLSTVLEPFFQRFPFPE